MRYAIVIEKADELLCLRPRLAGVHGANIQQVEAEIREAIEFHIDGLREDGSLIPLPSSQVEYVEVAA